MRRALLIISAIAVVAANAAPYVWSILTSLKKESEIFAQRIFPTELIADNYIGVMKAGFAANLWNSVIVSSFTTLVCLAIGIPAAYAFSRLHFKFKNSLFTVILAITVFPGIFIISPLFNFYSSIGAIDSYAALIIPYIAYISPMVIWILSGFFKTLPSSLEEAAQIDGCGFAGMIVRILIPISLPGIVTVAVISFTLAWNEFLFALIFTSSNDARTVSVAVSMFRGLHKLDWGQMSAAAVIASLPVVCINLLLQKYVISGLTAGAVKE